MVYNGASTAVFLLHSGGRVSRSGGRSYAALPNGLRVVISYHEGEENCKDWPKAGLQIEKEARATWQTGMRGKKKP